MGLDIVAISKAKLVACPGGDKCPFSHYEVGFYRKRKDGLTPGCYIKGEGGRSCFVGDASYAAYNAWRRHLSLLSLAVEPETVWEHPRRFRGKPFAELIDFPDGGGIIIGPKTSAKLYADFLAFSSKAKKYYQTPASQMSAQGPTRPKATSKRSIERARGLSVVAEIATAVGGVAHAPESEDRTWMWKLYLGFRRGFKLASDAGFVAFH
jgi:hypothetical protein